MKKKLLAVLGVFFMAMAIAVPSVSAKELKQSDYLEEFGQPQNPAQLLNVEGTLTIHDISREEVFAYVSDLENDPYLYPGTLSSVRVSGDGTEGTIYHETIVFGGILSNITATILEHNDDNWLMFKADNLLNNVSAYRLDNEGDDVELRLMSFVYVPAGVTQENMEAYMTLVFQNMLTAFNTTGEIEIE